MAGQRLLLSTRPEDETGRVARAAPQWQVDALPLLSMEPVESPLPSGEPDSLLFTSARAVHHMTALPDRLRMLPAYAVGEHSAAAARAAGFHLAAVGAADGAAIAAIAAADGRSAMLHPRGADTAPFARPAGLRILPHIVYRANLCDIGPERLRRAVGAAFAVLLFSPRTAAHFARLMADAGIARADTRIVAISANAAMAAGEGWRRVGISARPRLDSMVAAADALWQEASHG